MACGGCGTGGDTPKGCGSKGHCKSGGCSKLHVYDWLSDISDFTGERYIYHEVSFKDGARKAFFKNPKVLNIETGDYVLVESTVGYDIGRISLSGELVKLQMRKKGVKESSTDIKNIIRKANDAELTKLHDARNKEKETMLKARVLARNMGLDMKLGDVEFQADLRKATFYYTAEERVDFRELIKKLAEEFRVKIEMKQIGARQEAGIVGGIGACGRELCCSTWLTDFKSVNTSAARYQNLSINQSKLSGQCGRLKCCLNYELDSYMDAFKHFPDERASQYLYTENGKANLVKTDILLGIMHYQYEEQNNFIPLKIETVKEIIALNKAGKKPEDLQKLAIIDTTKEVVEEYEDLVGQISLNSLQKLDRKKSKKKRNPKNKGNRPNNPNNTNNPNNKPQQGKKD
jgi:cell fate regulator YaaT (PSP1 superfamily)